MKETTVIEKVASGTVSDKELEELRDESKTAGILLEGVQSEEWRQLQQELCMNIIEGFDNGEISRAELVSKSNEQTPSGKVAKILLDGDVEEVH